MICNAGVQQYLPPWQHSAIIFMENIAMFLYKTFQTGTSKMVIYDACLQDTIIMLMDATLSE